MLHRSLVRVAAVTGLLCCSCAGVMYVNTRDFVLLLFSPHGVAWRGVFVPCHDMALRATTWHCIKLHVISWRCMTPRDTSLCCMPLQSTRLSCTLGSVRVHTCCMCSYRRWWRFCRFFVAPATWLGLHQMLRLTYCTLDLKT